MFVGSSNASAAPSAYSSATRIATVLKTTHNDIGEQIRYAKTAHPEITVVRVSIPPGHATGWHTHPVQGVAYVMSGTLTLKSRVGGTHVYHTGQSFAESVNVVHQGVNYGNTLVELVVVFYGEKNHPYAIKAR